MATDALRLKKCSGGETGIIRPRGREPEDEEPTVQNLRDEDGRVETTKLQLLHPHQRVVQPILLYDLLRLLHLRA